MLALLTFSTSTKTLTELVSGLEFHLGLGNSTFDSVRDLIQINIALVQSTRNTIIVDRGEKRFGTVSLNLCHLL